MYYAQQREGQDGQKMASEENEGEEPDAEMQYEEDGADDGEEGEEEAHEPAEGMDDYGHDDEEAEDENYSEGQ